MGDFSVENEISNTFYRENWFLDQILSGMQMESSLKLLKDTNYISQDWKKTIAGLQLRLSEMIQQNTELNAVIQKLETELNSDKKKNRVNSSNL